MNMDYKYNQIKAFQQAKMMIHVITNDEYFYNGYVVDVYDDYFIINAGLRSNIIIINETIISNWEGVEVTPIWGV